MVPWPSDRCLCHLFHFPWDGWISSGPLRAATSVGDALSPRLPRLWQRMEAHELVSLFKGSQTTGETQERLGSIERGEVEIVL